MKPSARLYHCARCHCQVMICRTCDRGHVYCGEGCARSARAETLRQACKKYQSNRAGRFANALRQRRYKARQRIKVTQQGSSLRRAHDVLPLKQNNVHMRRQHAGVIDKTVMRCHFCQRECDVFLRLDFLSSSMRHRSRRESWINQK